MPDPVDCPLCLVDKHFIEPIPGQERGRKKHPSYAYFVCNVSKEALSDAVFGDSHKPKKYTSYWCSICKHALCIDPCFRLYHTEKNYTSEIIKIARTSVKPFQKDAQLVPKMHNMSKEATQSKWDNLTAWVYSTYTQVPESSIKIYHV